MYLDTTPAGIPVLTIEPQLRGRRARERSDRLEFDLRVMSSFLVVSAGDGLCRKVPSTRGFGDPACQRVTERNASYQPIR